MIYKIAVFILRIFFKIFYRFRVEFEVLPENLSGGVIIAPNHESYLDPPLVAAAWKKSLHFFAGEHLFKGWILGKCLPLLQSHPVVQGRERSTIRQAIELLNEGKSIVVFPEGTRSKDGSLSDLKSGVAYIAYMSKCPIIPCYIEGTYEAWPRGKKIPKFFGRMELLCRFGTPIYPEGEASKEGRDILSQKLFSEIRALRDRLEINFTI
jgi:1-acyl-sn-glycerol-3-phosphate acyltransferase